MTDAENEERRHELNRARVRAYRQRHPERVRAQDSAYSRAYRQRHPEYLERGRARNRAYYLAHSERVNAAAFARAALGQAYIDSLKVSGCVDCGNKNLAVLDFDHVRGEKSFNISNARMRLFAVIDVEVAKCEVRCANCHRITTAARRDKP